MMFIMAISHQLISLFGTKSGKFDPIDNNIKLERTKKMQPKNHPGFVLKEKLIEDTI